MGAYYSLPEGIPILEQSYFMANPCQSTMFRDTRIRVYPGCNFRVYPKESHANGGG